MFKHNINIVWSDEDEGFIATIPEFKNLSAFGKTYEDALKEAKIVLEGYIEILKEESLAIPEPFKLSDYSGQIRLRMPKDLHRELAIEAERQSMSLNSYMVYLLSSRHPPYEERLKIIKTEEPIMVVSSTGSAYAYETFPRRENLPKQRVFLDRDAENKEAIWNFAL